MKYFFIYTNINLLIKSEHRPISYFNVIMIYYTYQNQQNNEYYVPY